MKDFALAPACFAALLLAAPLAAQSPPAGARVAARSATPDPSARPAGVNVAVIDIGYIFKNHAGFKRKMEEVKSEVEAFESRMSQDRTRMTQLSEQIRRSPADTPDADRLEEQLMRQTADFKMQAGLKRREVMEKEARVYYETYQEIAQAVEDFAIQHQIALVIRYDRAEIDPGDRNSVLQGVSRAVVHQQSIDITQPVLEMLSR